MVISFNPYIEVGGADEHSSGNSVPQSVTVTCGGDRIREGGCGSIESGSQKNHFAAERTELATPRFISIPGTQGTDKLRWLNCSACALQDKKDHVDTDRR
ncbi:hypothetical protein SKAU_G00155240 [Synaphobranchus kaupii]|uniref:Uncharacterized protein n=1 Tax=Synaphobranchus kaupii TaxID=118154 RepID=A0A9Q1FHF9_SYNKA|nr:hypothetical protein SKAU_G00155240 [Synaphobranchus kaupii]